MPRKAAKAVLKKAITKRAPRKLQTEPRKGSLVASLVALEVGASLLVPSDSPSVAANVSQLVLRARHYVKKAKYTVQTCIAVPVQGAGATSFRLLRVTRTA